MTEKAEFPEIASPTVIDGGEMMAGLKAAEGYNDGPIPWSYVSTAVLAFVSAIFALCFAMQTCSVYLLTEENQALKADKVAITELCGIK